MTPAQAAYLEHRRREDERQEAKLSPKSNAFLGAIETPTRVLVDDRDQGQFLGQYPPFDGYDWGDDLEVSATKRRRSVDAFHRQIAPYQRELAVQSQELQDRYRQWFNEYATFEAWLKRQGQR